jgi:Holliday junction resolvasome RuvABC endonuclease subunit
MNFVGIDPGTNNAGWAIVNSKGEWVDSGQWNLAKDMPSRLAGWDSLIWRLDALASYAESFFSYIPVVTNIEAVGIEWAYYGKNIQTALKLGAAWGLIASPAFLAGLKVLHIPPVSARAIMYSHRQGDEGLVDIARRMGALCEDPGGEDEACAIGIALKVRKEILGL